MNNNTLSIIVPLLEPDMEFYRLLESLIYLQESPLDFEVIVISKTFFTLDLKYSFVKVYTEKRRGIYSAMNQGISLATGEYLYFIGKDDFVFPSFSSIALCLDGDADIIVFDTLWGSGRVYKNHLNKHLLLLRNWCHQGVFFKRHLFLGRLSYPRCFNVQADHYVNIRLSWGEKLVIKRLPVVGAFYSNSGYSTQHNDNRFKKLYPLILKKYCGFMYLFILKAFRSYKGYLS